MSMARVVGSSLQKFWVLGVGQPQVTATNELHCAGSFATPLIKSVTQSSLIADIHLASTCPRWPTTQQRSLPPPFNPYPSSAIPHLTTTSIHRPLHPRKSLPLSTPPATPSPLRTQSRQMSFVNGRAASLSPRFLTSVSNSPTSPASSLLRPGGRLRTSP